MRLAQPPIVRAPPPPSAAEISGRRPRAGHRRPSDSSIERIAMANSAKGAGRDSRPPPSMRNFASIAPIVNAPTPILRTYTHPQVDSLGSEQKYESSLPSSFNASLNTSATTLTGTATPQSMDRNPSPDHKKASSKKSSKERKERKAAKVTRFTELERIESGAEALVAVKPAAEPKAEETPAPVAPVAVSVAAPVAAPTPAPAPAPVPVPAAVPVAKQSIVINVFPEEDSIPEPEPTKKSKRFSKSGAKLGKKSRWASSKAPAVTV